MHLCGCPLRQRRNLAHPNGNWRLSQQLPQPLLPQPLMKGEVGYRLTAIDALIIPLEEALDVLPRLNKGIFFIVGLLQCLVVDFDKFRLSGL